MTSSRRKDPRDLLVGESYGTPTENRELSPEECNEMYNQNPGEWDRAMEAVRREFGGVPSKMEVVTKMQRSPLYRPIIQANQRARVLSDMRRKEKGIILL